MCNGETGGGLVQKTITYLYPDSEKASNFKIFQDRTNQIKAFYFTKENIKEIEKMDSSFNYAVYFSSKSP